MVIDTSVLVAILLNEPGHERLRYKIENSFEIAVGAPTLAETAVVLAKRSGDDPQPEISDLVLAFGIQVIPFTAEHYSAAIDAFLKFGKGRHPAALNFGDCLSYAAASVSGQPLLYMGNDFAQTDIQSA